MAAAELARSRIRKLFEDERPEVHDQVAYLGRALPNNITIEMGLAMYRLAGFREIAECTSGGVFASKLKERSFSPESLEAWDGLMEKYGFRGPMEMDVAAPRFYERPALFFEQLRTLAETTDAERNPQAIFDKARAQREKAYQNLLQVAQRKGKRKAKQFEKYYNILVELGGLRERPKYFVSLVTDMFRRHVLVAAQPLLDGERLDSPEQVFDLTMDELERGLADPSIDLRALAEKNTRFVRKLRQIRELPRIVDSRGKILRPPKKEAGEGELVGEPISPGVVRGPIKVLHEPDEKPVLPGEILVARVTDPGWTPLFLNAGGVILEVGGMLQHGALVAREYGKPCVAGIEDATSILKDGQVVEMDGANGVVQIT
jgi:phosphoenolpyruvate synthase/pyruvate phosphate dikinase